jgi:hypothetical protein
MPFLIVPMLLGVSGLMVANKTVNDTAKAARSLVPLALIGLAGLYLYTRSAK